MTSATAQIPHVPKQLEEFLGPLRSDWLLGFLFTSEPIHIPHLTNTELFYKRVIQSNLTITRNAATDSNEIDTLLQIRKFFLPVVTINDVTIGVGSAYYDTTCNERSDIPKPPGFPAPHIFYNCRFCVNHKDSCMYIVNNCHADNVLMIIRLKTIRKSNLKVETVCKFVKSDFLRTVHEHPSLPISKILPTLMYYCQTSLNVNATNTITDKDNNVQNSTQQQLVHPFDDGPFISSMRKFLGATNGELNEVILQDAFPILSFRRRAHNITESKSDPQLLNQLRDQTLKFYAMSLIESPMTDIQLNSRQQLQQQDQFQNQFQQLPYQNAQTPQLQDSVFDRIFNSQSSPSLQLPSNESTVNIDALNDERMTASANDNNLADKLFDEPLSLELDETMLPVPQSILQPQQQLPYQTIQPQPQPQLLPQFETSVGTNDINIVESSCSEVPSIENSVNHNSESANDSNSTNNSSESSEEMLKKKKREEMLRARRIRNRESAKRSNERVKQQRLHLTNNIVKNKELVETLRKKESQLRAENVQLRKQVSISKSIVNV